MGARPFHRQQHRAAPLAADADALQCTQEGQQDRAPDADRCKGWNKSDQKCRDAHAEKRRDQRRLAADAIAVMTENRRSNRPGNKADEVGAEGKQRRRQRVLIGEVELAKNEAGGGAVEEKVVPFDGGADRRRDHRLAQLRAVFRLRQRHVCRSHSHGIPPRITPFAERTFGAPLPENNDTSGCGALAIGLKACIDRTVCGRIWRYGDKNR